MGNKDENFLMPEKHHLAFLDGLRGLLCLFVILDHCVNDLKPDLRWTGLSGGVGDTQRFVAWSPLNIFYNGIPSVCLFFIMSGFVLSYKFNKNPNFEILPKAAFKRYFRFALPILATYVLVYFIIPSATVPQCLWQALYSVEFSSGPFLDGPLWTIPWEVSGSFLIFALLALGGKSDKRIFIYLCCFLFFFFRSQSVEIPYFFFLFGLIASYFYSNSSVRLNYGLPIGVIGFLVGIFLCTYPYPHENVTVGGLYSFITFSSNPSRNFQLWASIGSLIVFISLFSLPSFIKCLSNSLFQFLGRISFPIYLLHILVLMVVSRNLARPLSFLYFTLAAVVVVTVSIIISIPFEKFIDYPARSFSNRIAKDVH